MKKIILKAWITPNWGDAINGELVRLITGIEPVVVKGDTVLEVENYLVVGSIVHFTDHHSIVWGAGVLDEGTTFVNYRPKKVCAVRGPKSREQLLKYNIPCPEIYGDPILLLPGYYQKTMRKKYKLGIIPNWEDEWLLHVENMRLPEGVIKIRHDVGIYQFIDLILSCEKVASSSLHGLVVADAYGIPAIRLLFCDEKYQFKFEDYFQSVGRPFKKPLRFDGEIDTKKILRNFYNYDVKIDLDKLLEACPFK